jgi:hypothetical protein
MSAFNTVKSESREDHLDEAFYQEEIDITCICCFYKKLQMNNKKPHLILQLYDYVKGSCTCACLGWVCGNVGMGPCILKIGSRWR